MNTKKTRKERKMRQFILVLVAVFATLKAEASPMPALPQDVSIVGTSECVDHESKQKGICFMFSQSNGDFWMVFVQDDQPKFMRWVPKGEDYQNVWIDERFNSF